MESDDDYESFSFPNVEPSPSPKHRKLKRLKKSTDVTVQSTAVDSVTEAVDLPKVNFARLEVLESSNIRAFVDNNNNDDVLSEPPSDRFNGDGDAKELCHRFRNGNGDGDEKELRSRFRNGNGDEEELSPRFRSGNGNGDGDEKELSDGDGEKVKELRSCYDDEAKEDMEIKEVTDDGDDDDDVEKKLGCGDGDDDVEKELGDSDVVVRTDRKETKRQLDFGDEDDDDVDESGVDKMVGKEGESADMEVRVDEEKEGDEDVANEKKWKNKKKRSKSGGDDKPKAKSTYTSKRREEKERRAHLDQLHVESQRILRETRGVSFKPVPLVQKPVSSILERIRQRKLEVSKKFSQSNTSDSHKEDDEHGAIDHSKSVETEVSDLSESLKQDKVSNVMNVDPVSDGVGMDGPDVCGEQKGDANACSKKELDVESTPALRAPVDDTQELFGDSQTSDGKESEDDESCENDSSSQEEEMGPSLLTMKLKFDSAPDDICDDEEEDNDKENVEPHGEEHSSPRGDPAKAFVDDEAEEEDDSDNDQMVFGDDEEDEDEDDIEELNKMIVTGYKERPIDLEARNELHQKWLEEKDEAGTDVILRKFNLDSKLREASLLDEEEGDVDVEMNDDDDANEADEDDDENDVEEEAERPRLTRINAKKAKEMIAQMFTDKDDEYISSDDEETEKILVRERLLNKDKEKGRMLSMIEDEDSREVFGLIKKLNTVPEVRKKANATSFFDTLLTGGNSNSSSKSSFFSRKSSNSVPFSSKQGGSSGAKSFIFGRDDSNSRSSISLSLSEDMPDTTTSSEMQTKKATAKYKRSQSQGISSTQTTILVSESSSSSSSFFELLKRSSAQSNVHNHDHKVELSQSVFDAFKIPKKPIKIQGRV